MCRPSQNPHLTKSSEQINRQRGQLWSQSSQRRKSQCNGIRKMTSGASRSPKLPLTLHFRSDVTKSGQSQAQQGLLSPLIMPSPFPWRWFRWMADGDSGDHASPSRWRGIWLPWESHNHCRQRVARRPGAALASLPKGTLVERGETPRPLLKGPGGS